MTVTPILVTRDLDRLHAFYAGLFDATEVVRVPDEGPSSTWACGSATPSWG